MTEGSASQTETVTLSLEDLEKLIESRTEVAVKKALKDQKETQVEVSSPTSNKTEEHVWIENKRSSATRFIREGVGSFHLARVGYEGSITQVASSILEDTFVQRAISRGFLAVLGHQEAVEKISDLQEEDHDSDWTEARRLYMDEGASENASRYTRELPEEAEPGRSIPVDQVWKGEKSRPSRETKTVKRSMDLSGPLDPQSVLQPAEKEIAND